MKNNILVINGKKLVLFILFFTIIMETLIAEFHFPSIIRYFNDLAIVLIIVLMNVKFIKLFKDNKCQIVLYGFGLFLIACITSAILNLVPFRLVFWAFRNTFRGIIFFFAICYYLDEKDLEKILNILIKIQIINLILAIYQFFILHHTNDFIGGIFGYGNGAGVNIFNALIISFTLNNYLTHKKGIFNLIFAIISSLIIAALAEEKMTYLLFVLIFIISIFLSKFSYKKIVAILIAIVGLSIGMIFIKEYYPNTYSMLTDFEKLIEYSETTYDEGYRIPRVGAFKVIENLFLDSNFEKVLGLGFGNCENSSFEFFNSTFYKIYGDYNYRWFTHQWIFLECGYFGVISFVFMFICIGIALILNLKKLNNTKKTYIMTSLCMIACCIATIWYNATLKVDMSYLAYFSIAVGFIPIFKNENEIIEGEKKI